MKEKIPFGAWPSEVGVDSLVSGGVSVSEIVPEENAIWWAESRTFEGGRTALMRYANGEVSEVTPRDCNVRSLVHEYGGGAWWVDSGVCYFVDYSDQRIRVLRPEDNASVLTELTVLTPNPSNPKGLRFADIRIHPDGQWLTAVAEDHATEGGEPANYLVAVATDGSMKCSPIEKGADFYGSPRISPNGRYLAWVQWNHPNMPWDDTELMVADMQVTDDGVNLLNHRRVAGGVGEAVVQPEWSPDGMLHFLSDRSDLWQLYCDGKSEPVETVAGEIGYPPWVFGLARYGFKTDGSVVYAFYEGGVDHMDGEEGFSAFHSVRVAGDKVAFAASSWTQESTVYYDQRQVHTPKSHGLAIEDIAIGEPITCLTADGSEVFALYYSPRSTRYCGPEGDKPPLIVLAHGGPTSAARSQFSLARHFWTSRGFAVVDVNYRGSSGFGRKYRKKLEGQWGISDVEDCVHVANYLVQRGDVDSEKLIIRGGSAGGYTVLCALAFHETFTAGANMYGVADLEALASDTHKFESRYLDSLVGPYPETKERYQARSPIHHLDGFSAPMIVLQGSEDAIVPPNQSRMIVDALRQRDIPVVYLEFAGEQHGFRKAETIKKALGAELMFYGKVFGFTPDTGLPTKEQADLSDLLKDIT